MEPTTLFCSSDYRKTLFLCGFTVLVDEIIVAGDSDRHRFRRFIQACLRYTPALRCRGVPGAFLIAEIRSLDRQDLYGIPLASISSQAESTVWPNSSLFASHFSCLAVLCVLALLLDADEFDCPDMPLPINPIMKMATTAKIMIFLFNDFLFSNSLPSTISPICDCDVLGFDGAGYCLSSSMVVVVPIMLTL